MATYPEKKDATLPVAMSTSNKAKITAFANFEGISGSEFMHNLAILFLAEKENEAIVLSEIFSLQKSNK